MCISGFRSRNRNRNRNLMSRILDREKLVLCREPLAFLDGLRSIVPMRVGLICSNSDDRLHEGDAEEGSRLRLRLRLR